MNQALSMRENTARPALETIQANQHELQAARVVQLLANMDRLDVDAILGIATQRLHELADQAVQKTLPKYLIHRKEEAALNAWRARPNGIAPKVRVLSYNEVIAKSGDYRPADELPDYHLRAIAQQHDKDLEHARHSAQAQARSDAVAQAALQVATVEQPPKPPLSPDTQVAPEPGFDIDAADKEALRVWVEKEFNYDLDLSKPLKLLRDQARELVRQRAASPPLGAG